MHDFYLNRAIGLGNYLHHGWTVYQTGIQSSKHMKINLIENGKNNVNWYKFAGSISKLIT
jgi:hypothetical protein